MKKFFKKKGFGQSPSLNLINRKPFAIKGGRTIGAFWNYP